MTEPSYSLPPNESNINKLIARLEQDLIEHKGVHFAMRNWAAYLRDCEYGKAGEEAMCYVPCNTACCLAGHANVLRLLAAGRDLTEMGVDFYTDVGDPYEAGDWLGISRENAHQLFYMWGGLYQEINYRDQFDRLPPAVRVKAAIEVLSILRDEFYVDWDRALAAVGVDYLGPNAPGWWKFWKKWKRRR